MGTRAFGPAGLGLAATAASALPAATPRQTAGLSQRAEPAFGDQAPARKDIGLDEIAARRISLEQRVVDIVARDRASLIEQLDGRTVSIGGAAVVLDTRGLAVLLAYARAMKESGIKVKQDIIFVGNVGEEGPGDLRGVRYLLTKGKYKDRVKA